jgi:hypothetical protein
MDTGQIASGMRRLGALLVASVVVVVAMAGTVSARAQSMDAATCASADLLTRDGLPRRALALLAAVPQPTTLPTCAAAEDAAQTAVQDSAMLSLDAGSFAEDDAWPEALAAATAALALDRENAAAATLQTQAQEAIDDGEEESAAAEEEGKSWFERLVDQWKVLLDEQLSPLGTLLLPFVGVLLLLVLLARLVVLVVRDWPEPDAPTVGSSGKDTRELFRLLVLVGGVLSVAGASFMASAALSDSYSDPVSLPMAGSAAVVALLACVPMFVAAHVVEARLKTRGKAIPSWPVTAVSSSILVVALLGLLVRGSKAVDVPRDVELAWSLGLAALLAVQGVCLLAWWLATRIRLDIKASSDAEIGAVAALLSELGAEKPKGLEVPRGADVTALDGVLASLPDNPVLKVLKDILRSISGVTPWTATIEGDATARVVTVVRNGKTVGSAIIDPERLCLTPTAEDPDEAKASAKASSDTEAPDHTLKMAAAFVLMTMAEAHPVIRRGLAGAVTWKGLGYHYVASTLPPGGTLAQELFARALDDDPENRAARLAFRHSIDRESTECQPLSRYAAFLDSFIKDLDTPATATSFDTTTLRMRAIYTRAVIGVNAVHAHESGEHGSGPDVVDGRCSFLTSDHQTAAVAALKTLDGLVRINPDEGVTDDDPLRTFKIQFKDRVSGLRLLVRLDEEHPSPNSPTGMYNLGCTYASFDDVSWPPVPAEAEAQEEAGATAQRAPEPTTPPAAAADVAAPTAADARDPEDPGKHDKMARSWLDLACEDPENKKWLANDPQLLRFRQRATYRTTYLADPRKDFFTLSTVEPMAKQLRSVGYGDVSLIAEASPVTLGSLLLVDPTVSSQLVELARLQMGLRRFTPRIEPEPDPSVTQALEWLTAQLEAASAPTADSAWPLALGLDLLSQLSKNVPPPPAAPQPEPATPPHPLRGWEIEILDQLTSQGLARRTSLVAVASSERTVIAEKVVAALMKTHKPTATTDLPAFEVGLAGHLARWMQSPY